MNLTGTYLVTLDAKGRAVIPAPFRTVLGDSVTLMAGPNQAILLRLLGQPFEGLPALIFEEPVSAPSGRILIPYALRQWAGLPARAELAVCGLGERVAILTRERWEAATRAGRDPLTPDPTPVAVPPPVVVSPDAKVLEAELARARADVEWLRAEIARLQQKAPDAELARYRRIFGPLKAAVVAEALPEARVRYPLAAGAGSGETR
jgi:DNA-binding transcriptional regulator/RsmH inhibitor MraZ